MNSGKSKCFLFDRSIVQLFRNRNFFLSTIIKNMEASKAEEIATSPDELQDLQDDQLIHQQTEPGTVSKHLTHSNGK